MKFSISNIAWDPKDDSRVAECMNAFGVSGVEIAPTKVWDRPLEAGSSSIRQYREFWESRDIQITSMQALLFGKPELTLFENESVRRATVEYLKGIIGLAGQLGAGILVFGSPKNRLVGELPEDKVLEIAVAFFREIAAISELHGVVFCIEPNPVAYGCDFITDSVQGLELVQAVDHLGFGLHLDAAGMVMSNEDICDALDAVASGLYHFHISEPNLAPIGAGSVDHSLFSAALKKMNYTQWRSIEMRPPGGGDDNAEAVCQAMERAVTLYS